MGKLAHWLRWFAVFVGLILTVRIITAVLLPLLPVHLAWGSAVMLGAAVTFFVLPLAHEHTL